MNRAATLLVFLLTAGLLVLIACGGGGSSAPGTSRIKKRVFVTNNFSSFIDIVDADRDLQSPFTIPAGGSAASNIGLNPTFMVLSGDKTTTLVFDAGENGVTVVDNAKESETSKLNLSDWTESIALSPDNKTAWAAVRNQVASGQTVPGAVQVLDLANTKIGAVLPIPRVHWIVLNHAGTKLLAFSDLSDTISVIDVATNTITPVASPSFNRPVWAIFSSDDSKAYVLSCGIECGGTAPANPSLTGAGVTVLDMTTATPTPGASVPVSGATTGLLNANNLYLAGTVPATPAAPATGYVNVVDISTMTATSTTPGVVIGDGYHTLMSLTSNNKLYIGARNCTNNAAIPNSGCLSIYDVAAKSAVVPTPNCAASSGTTATCGDVTGIQPITGRNVVYVVQGGELVLYDLNTSALFSNQIDIAGKVGDAKLVDP